jgi:PAS domain S-box-containing protein
MDKSCATLNDEFFSVLMSFFMSLFSAIGRWWGRFSEPPPSVTSQGLRFRLRTFMLIFFLSGVLVAATAISYFLQSFTEPGLHFQTISVSISTIVLFVAFALTRRGHLQSALILICVYGAPANWLIVVVRDDPRILQFYDYLSLYAIIGALFLSRRVLIAVLVYSALWMLSTPYFTTTITLAYVLEGPFLFNVMLYIIAMVGTAIYRAAERERRMAIERERIFYKALFEQSNDAVFLLNLDGSSVAANKRGEQLLGYSLDETPGIFVAQVIAAGEEQESLRRRQAMLDGETLLPYERTLRHRDGYEIPTEINTALIRDAEGKPIYIQSIVRDIRDRRRQQAERLQLALAEERMATMRQFVAAISHDFRTTLAQIEMGAHLVGRMLQAGKPDAVGAKLEGIHASVAHMSDQLQNLATVASLMTLTTSPCDINALVKAAGVWASERNSSNKIRLVYHLDEALPLVSVDESKLGSALRQLFINAFVHASREGLVEIATSMSGGFVVITVTDDGAGIDPSHLQRLFEPLYRTDLARTVDSGGLGLGLTIVKLVTEAHHGKIEVESAPEHGSRFHLMLPVG